MRVWAAVMLAVTCAACGGGSTETPATEAVPAEGQAAADQPGAAGAPAGASRPRDAAPRPAPVVREREITVPAGTVLRVELSSAVSSDASQVEDTVRGTLRQALEIEGATVLPAGTEFVGTVTDVERSGRVKGRARLVMRFRSVRHRSEVIDLQSEPLAYEAEATKGEDAKKIGIGAGVGAAVGAVVGGAKGAAKGAAIGAGAGTGAVLATRGEEVRLGSGTPVDVRLTGPLVLRVPR